MGKRRLVYVVTKKLIELVHRYLEANVHMAYVLLRMLERWGSKHGGLYIRKTKKKKTGNQSNYMSCKKIINSRFYLAAGNPEEEGVVDDVSDEDTRITEEILQEMTLEKFEHVSFSR